MDPLEDIVRRYWGYTTLRPLQRDAMEAAVEGRDSLVVMPTGGGKSLCYQVPAVMHDDLTLVISPLISLMKDQVDRLDQVGIPAAFLNSSLEMRDRRRVEEGLRKNEYRLLFVAPERFANGAFCQMLQGAKVKHVAVDEAHCISHWGHDFRADYRQLGRLRGLFPEASIHAFTATATPQVREDIISQLGLREPAVLVGDFFRPNLNYAVKRRWRADEDVAGVLREHSGQAGIIYCMRRRDVDELVLTLRAKDVKVIGYHAGMGDEARVRAQDAFSAGEVDVVVATVAFGMGIDRSDIRFVAHTAMPKSIEHYQQETGRAGRDGEPADCILFYSGADFQTWKSILDDTDSEVYKHQLAKLSDMYAYASRPGCRHGRLVGYFGQAWERVNCEACDYCGGKLDTLPDATTIARKILSCVARTEQRYGTGHVVDVLIGKLTEKVSERRHDQLSVFGLLEAYRKPQVMGWVDQLVDQEFLRRDGEYRVLKITTDGMHLLRGNAEAVLYDDGSARSAKKRKGELAKRAFRHKGSPRSHERKGADDGTRRELSNKSRASSVAAPAEPLNASERDLFERLRAERRVIADEENVPAFYVCSDKTLREIARKRPTSRSSMLAIKGIGAARFDAFGERFIEVIAGHSG